MRRFTMAEMRRDKLSIYIPQEKLKEKPIERLMKLAKEKDRSVNYLVVKAILEFVEREEKGK
jgi:predicted transcriptional regulator